MVQSAAASRVCHFLLSKRDWWAIGTGKPRDEASAGVKKGKVMSQPVDMTKRSQGRAVVFARTTEEFSRRSMEERWTVAWLIVFQKLGELDTPTFSEHQNILFPFR